MTINPNPAPAEPLPGRRTFLGWLTYGLGAVATAALGIPLVGYFFGVRKAPIDWLTLGPVTDFAQGQTHGDIRQPHPPAVGRHGGAHGRLCPLRGPGRGGGGRDDGAQVPGPRGQLQAPGLPGGVVLGVGPVHVPLSRRSVLRQRRAARRDRPRRGLYPLRLPGDPGARRCSSWKSRAPHFPTLQDTLATSCVAGRSFRRLALPPASREFTFRETQAARGETRI